MKKCIVSLQLITVFLAGVLAANINWSVPLLYQAETLAILLFAAIWVLLHYWRVK